MTLFGRGPTVLGGRYEIEKALRAEPEERYATAGLLAEALAAVRAESLSSA